LTGKPVDLRVGQPEADDPARGVTWDRRRIVSAPLLVLHDAPEPAEAHGAQLPLPLPRWEEPELDPATQARVRAMLAAEVAACLAN
jgi:hypothetical protein